MNLWTECPDCGFGWSSEFELKYPEVVKKQHDMDHGPYMTARLQLHIVKTLERLLGKDEESLD